MTYPQTPFIIEALPYTILKPADMGVGDSFALIQAKAILAYPASIVKMIFALFLEGGIFVTAREIVEVIEAALVKKKISKGEFYRACGITSGHMSNWRKGKNYPQTPTLVKISEYLDLDLMGAKIPAIGDDGEMNELLQTLRERPEMKMLFDAGKKATPETVRRTARLLEEFARDDDD